MPRVSEKYMRERRAQIVSAALRCFRAKGIAETRMRDIFAESGLSAGAVYNHFPSKGELVMLLAKESDKKWLEMFAGFEDEPEPGPKKKLKELVLAMVDGLGRPETVADIGSDIGIWAFSIHKDQLRDACREVFCTIAQGFDRILSGRNYSGGHDNPPTSFSAGAHILAHLQGLGLQASMGMTIDLEREKELLSAMIDSLVEESR